MNVLAAARRLIDAGPVCDPCLGRPFAERSFGLTNHERGRALRTAVALADDEPYEPFDDECWVCEGECDRYDWWAEQAATALRGYEFATYQVGTRVPPLLEENDRLFREDADLDPEAGERLKSEFNREVGKRLGERTGTEVDFERPDVLVLCDLSTDDVEVQVNSAFVYGRYRKLERDVPQTEWPCRECNETGIKRGEECPGCDGTGYRYDRSVEELTAPVVADAMEGADATFHGAGREDVDALMLGDGRPFVIEVDEPRVRDVDVEGLQADVNEYADGAVEVAGLRLATHEMVERVKEHDASKTYRMDVTVAEPVSAVALDDALAALSGETVHQETPERVSHRRAAKTRTRAVYDAAGRLVPPDADDADARAGSVPEPDESTRAMLTVHGAGGLYVKELVNGDGGRTEPSLAGLLGTDATVTALDVLDVTGEDESFEHPDYFRSGEDLDETGASRE